MKKEDLEREVLESLQREPKAISPKFFYDRRGSELFEKICGLPEYYPARASLNLLKRHVREIAVRMGHPELLFEYGGGNSRKIRILLSHLPGLKTYAPIDISREHLMEASRALAADFPRLNVAPVFGDYTRIRELAGPWRNGAGKKVCFFPGSTIGNLLPEEVSKLLMATREIVAADGGLLVGVDLKKDVRVLEAAYNDYQGVTADFNLNILRRLNDELTADFDLDAFRHRAFYNERLGRIEMHLESLKNQTVSLGGRRISFQKGETIHTENSYKYSVEEFRDLAVEGGFRSDEVWTDPERLFSLHYLEVS